MSITVLSDVIVPNRVIMAGASGRVTRQNDRTTNQAGYATVNVVRDVTLREYTLGVKPMLIDRWEEIMGLYEVTEAGAYGMLIEDPSDSAVSATQGGMTGFMAGVRFGTPGFGNGGPTYVLQKFYRAATSTRLRARDVTRPNGTPALLRNGSPVTLGVAAGNAALSAAPVMVTFVADATRSVVAVTVGASTQIELASSISGLAIGGRLWLTGLTGADAALVNNLSHQITAITGAMYTIAVNTAGKTVTAAGSGAKYPQPTDTLGWSGSYYVPVQFSDDAMEWDLARPGDIGDRLIAGPSVPLVEIRES